MVILSETKNTSDEKDLPNTVFIFFGNHFQNTMHKSPLNFQIFDTYIHKWKCGETYLASWEAGTTANGLCCMKKKPFCRENPKYFVV